jgi:starch synthase (maltosyl-transferring)
LDAGRYPIKRVVGDKVVVDADIFADGHEVLSAVVRFRHAGETAWAEASLRPLLNDRWRGQFEVTRIGNAFYCLEAWVDHFQSWRRDTQKKLKAGQDVSTELLTCAQLLEEGAARACGSDIARLRDWAKEIRKGGPNSMFERTRLALADC